MDPDLRKLLMNAKAAGANDDQLGQLIDKWHADHAAVSAPAIPAVPSAQADASSALPFNRPNPTGDLQASSNLKGQAAHVGPAILGNLANVAQGIPGMEAVEAGARSVVRRQPYREALSDIRNQTDAIPPGIKRVERMAGAAPLAGILPGSPAVAGAILGGADPALQADPDVGVGQRAGQAVVGAGLGAAAGKVLDAGVTKFRSMKAPTLGRAARDREAATGAADAIGYGQSAAEAQAVGGTSPAIREALDDVDMRPYASAIRSSRTFRNADDATVLREAYKLMSERQGLLEGRLSSSDFKQGTSLENRDIGATKDMLRSAAASPSTKPPLSLDIAPETYSTEPIITAGREPAAGPVRSGTLNTYTAAQRPPMAQTLRDFPNPSSGEAHGPGGPGFQLRGQPEHVTPGVEINTPGMRVQTAPAQQVPPAMPSFPAAVEQHAEAMGERDAFRQGADMTRRVISGKGIAARNLEKKSPETFLDGIPTMTTGQKAAAQQGVLGRLKESPTFARLPLVHLPVPVPSRAFRTTPDLLRQINAPGQSFIDLLTKLGLSTANSPFANP